MTSLREKNSSPKPADIKNVVITDSFFKPYIDKIRDITVKDVFRKFIADGAIENYRRVTRGEKGGHAGPPWYHGLICEVIRGVSDMLAVTYDADIDAELDMMIDAILEAQSEDGWLHPYDTLMCPGKEWGLNGGSARYQHETYDHGCMIEAGVHHYKATGKTVVAVDERFYRPTDVVDLWGDPKKAKEQLGWDPQETSYEELVRIMAEHDWKLAKAQKAALQ